MARILIVALALLISGISWGQELPEVVRRVGGAYVTYAPDTFLPAKPARIVLRINDFYVVHTPPIAPYLDSSGRVMVSLSGFARMLDGQEGLESANIDYGRTWATLSFADTELSFFERQREDDPDRFDWQVRNHDWGLTFPLAVPPRFLPGGEMVVPLRSLTQALGMEVTWDPVRKLAWIKDPRLLEEERLVARDEAPRPRTEALFPTYYRITPVPSSEQSNPQVGSSPEPSSYYYDFELWVKDQSPEGIPEDQEGIFIIYGPGYLGRQHRAYPPGSQGPPPPCRRVEGGFYCRVKIGGVGSGDLNYILTLMALASPPGYAPWPEGSLDLPQLQAYP